MLGITWCEVSVLVRPNVSEPVTGFIYNINSTVTHLFNALAMFVRVFANTVQSTYTLNCHTYIYPHRCGLYYRICERCIAPLSVLVSLFRPLFHLFSISVVYMAVDCLKCMSYSSCCSWDHQTMPLLSSPFKL